MSTMRKLPAGSLSIERRDEVQEMGLDGYCFDDEKMRDFLVQGFCVLRVDYPRSFHERIYEQTQKILAQDGNPGNNILPRIPEVQKVFDHPAVRGALTSLLGPTYVMHVHRHPHVNGPQG